MESLWDDNEAKALKENDLDMRVYTSRLLGRNADLVLHGGGNTSVKITEDDLFGVPEQVLYVKGSGWDLKTIEPAGFAPTRLEYLQKLGTLPSMTDSRMAKELKASQIDPDAPAPSVEAILHANIPFKFVDHSHADAIVAVSNTPNGEKYLADIFGGRILILPYVMPGFILAKQVFDATIDLDWSSIDGILLMHHGLFTFHDDARISYENHIKLVSKAEDLLKEVKTFDIQATAAYHPTTIDFLTLAAVRKQVSTIANQPMLARWKLDEFSVGYSAIDNVSDLATRGPLTPDHTLHTKRTAAILDNNPANGIEQFTQDYQSYFKNFSDKKQTCLDIAPRYAVWKNRGLLSFGSNHKRLAVVSDISDHTIKAIQWGEALGGWQALPAQDIFDIEYWELEQAKLKKITAKPTHEGKIALVTGAASGIGLACVKEMMAQGACVVGLDIDKKITEQISGSNYLGLVCDVTNSDKVKQAITQTIAQFGGLDIIVSNAGAFPISQPIAELSDKDFQKSLDLNLISHVKLIREATPFLKLGIDPTIILIASKNVPAPGPGAGSYSAAKAALTQIGRVAALELGNFGIRVNMIHPNAVFDTAVWNEEVLQQRAQHYGMSVENYKRNNVLQTEVTSENVAALVATMAGPIFSKTTGAQLPIDGGNDRVI